jgi:hypothetical protein
VAVGAVLAFAPMPSGANTDAPMSKAGDRSTPASAAGGRLSPSPVDHQPVTDRLDALPRGIAQLRQQPGLPASPAERAKVEGGNKGSVAVEAARGSLSLAQGSDLGW